MWFAAVVARDHEHRRARTILTETADHVTTDHVVVETWLMLNRRYHTRGAELFWHHIRRGAAHVEIITAADLEAAWAIGQAFSNQAFSIVDRTSFAVMERLGLTRVASFDDDFAVYRYGRNRDRAFNVLR